jgi:flagellar biosynthesis/type III secretory pathway chaperone
MSAREEKIRGFLEAKIALYRQLQEVLEEERTSLMVSNVARLWKLANQKQQIVSQIEHLRGDFVAYMDDCGISHGMTVSDFQLPGFMALIPEESSLKLSKHLGVIDRLKKEIQSLASDNRQFVEEYLSTLNELVGIFTGGQKPAPTYTKASYAANAQQSSVLLHREV